MHVQNLTGQGAPHRQTARFRPIVRVVMINLVIWLTICALGAVSSYQDALRHGSSVVFLSVLGSWVNNHLPLFVLSSSLFLALQRHARWAASSQAIAKLYGSLAVLFFPLHMLYVLVPAWMERGTAVNLLQFTLQQENFVWFLEFSWFSGTFAVVIGVHIWHLGQLRASALQQSQTTNLNLQLALEQQRMRSMRQQLEPHFLFNALNAISALVRGNNKAIALDGLQNLSDLLRHALKFSNKDWGCIGDELRFIHDYLALQQLRYGDRLQASITGVTSEIEQVDCPPLLLQPLIENALRHDLDCHELPGQIDIHFALNAQTLEIRIRNTVLDRKSHNPGLGLGLSQTRARLEMMYVGKASLAIHEAHDSFKLLIELPMHRPD